MSPEQLRPGMPNELRMVIPKIAMVVNDAYINVRHEVVELEDGTTRWTLHFRPSWQSMASMMRPAMVQAIFERRDGTLTFVSAHVARKRPVTGIELAAWLRRWDRRSEQA